MSQDIRDGSVRTVWTVSFPLILSFLSALAMVTVDRFFLAQYSPVALSAAVSAGMHAWAITYGGQALTGISTIFVAQRNGAGAQKRLGEPVWQMLWLSVLFLGFFVVAGIYFPGWAFAGSPIEAEQISYYRWSLTSSPLVCAAGALNGFFIGRGQTGVITWLTILGNAVNLVLDPLLIFGWGPVPSLGKPGACIATTLGVLTQLVVLLALFLRQESRKRYGTGNAALRPALLWECVRIGGPESLAMTLELSAWGVFYVLLNDLSAVHILCASVGQTILIGFFWFGIGMEHGLSTVAGNLMGAGRKDEVARAFSSGLKVVGLFGVALMALLTLGAPWIVDLFLRNPEQLEGAEHLTTLTPADIAVARDYLIQACGIIGAYMILENIRGLLYGVLRASGDTFFILLVSVFATWALLLLPTYVLMTLWQSSVAVSFWIWLGFAGSTTAIAYARYASGGWKERELLTAHA